MFFVHSEPLLGLCLHLGCGMSLHGLPSRHRLSIPILGFIINPRPLVALLVGSVVALSSINWLVAATCNIDLELAPSVY